MAKYTQDVKELLAAIGGKENIKAVTHCMTRMRFVLIDDHKADLKKIEQIKAVKGTFNQAGQFQVIIGNDVAVFYNEFTANSGVEGVSKDELKAASATNQTLLQRMMGTLGEIFAPIIPALICGGLILGFRNIIGEIKLLEDGTLTLAQSSQFWAGLYNFLWLIGEAVFHMLPVGIVWSITRKMGTTQILGIVLGLTLVSPQLLNAFAVASTAPDQIPNWDFGFAKISMIGYQGQVIAAILAGFVLAYLERFFKRICPEMISMIVVPFCSLVPAVIIAHTIVGPIGWQIGDFIATVVYSGLTSSVKWLFAAIFGFLYAPVVMTGLHHMTNAIDTQLVSLYGGTILWPMIALSNIAQGSAVLAMSFLQRQNERAQQVNIPACISCYLGVTEPALFGVNMKYGFPLICGMTGSAIAAMICVGSGVEAYSIGVGGLPGILSIKPDFWLSFLLAMAAAIAVPVALTFTIGKKKLTPKALYGDNGLASNNEESKKEETKVEVNTAPTSNAKLEIKAPLSGEVIALEQLPDAAFAQGIMGKGVGIKPSGNQVVAPCDAVVSVVAQSQHAINLTFNNGAQMLIHVGMDTVNLKGKGFKCLVKQGQAVKTGEVLMTFDPQVIKDANLALDTAVLISEDNGCQFKFMPNQQAVAGETVIMTEE